MFPPPPRAWWLNISVALRMAKRVASLSGAALRVEALREEGRAELVDLLESLPGSKCLVLEGHIGGLLNHVIPEGSKVCCPLKFPFFWSCVLESRPVWPTSLFIPGCKGCYMSVLCCWCLIYSSVVIFLCQCCRVRLSHSARAFSFSWRFFLRCPVGARCCFSSLLRCFRAVVPDVTSVCLFLFVNMTRSSRLVSRFVSYHVFCIVIMHHVMLASCFARRE